MASFILLFTRGHFVLTGLTIEPMKFETRREAKEWVHEHFPGSLVTEVTRRPNLRLPFALKKVADRREKKRVRKMPEQREEQKTVQTKTEARAGVTGHMFGTCWPSAFVGPDRRLHYHRILRSLAEGWMMTVPTTSGSNWIGFLPRPQPRRRWKT